MIKQDSIKTQAEIEAEQTESASNASQIVAMENLTVEVEGMTFQANELSRQRMADAILASDYLQETQTTWRLADNTQADITLVQLKEAHAKAMVAFGALIIT